MAGSENALLFGIVAWLLITNSVFLMLPSEFAMTEKEIEANDLIENMGDDGSINTADIIKVGLFGKIVRLFFVPFVVSGIPLFVGIVLAMANYFCVMVALVWFWDKVWIG